MKRYTQEEYQIMLKDAQNNLKDFTAKTILEFQTSLDNLTDKYKKEHTWDEYEKAKKLVSDFIYTNYPKTEEILVNGSVFYTAETGIFFNLVCEIPSIDKQLEEIHKAFLLDAFQ